MLWYPLNPAQVPGGTNSIWEQNTQGIVTTGPRYGKFGKIIITNCQRFLISQGNRRVLRGLHGHHMDKVDGWKRAAVEGEGGG